jgi:hypothetical protein
MDRRRELHRLATSFRRMLEKYCRQTVSTNCDINLYHSFPEHCCYDGSLLLSRYLFDHGFRHIDLITTTCHAWLLTDGYIVDVTGDQVPLQHMNLKAVEVVPSDDPRYRDMKDLYEISPSDYRTLYHTEPNLIRLFDRTYSEIIREVPLLSD